MGVPAGLSNRGMRVFLASIIAALVASASLPPTLAVGAPGSQGVERRDVTPEASEDSCERFEAIGQYRLERETDLAGDCSIDCVLSAPVGPYGSWATVCLGLYASPMDAQEAWDESVAIEGTYQELYRTAIIDVWTSDLSDGDEAAAAFVTVAKGVVDSLAASESDQDDGEDSVPAGFVLLADDFDHENGGAGMLDYAAFAHWTVDEGTVDLLGEGLYDFHPDAGLYLDLDGSRDAGGTLVSKEAFALTSGRYRLEFDLAGHPFSGPETVTVALGEVFTEDFSLPHDPDFTGFEHMVRDIVVETETEARLSFGQHGGDNVGVLLDGVRLSRLPDEPELGDDASAPAPPSRPPRPPHRSCRPRPGTSGSTRATR